MTKPLADIFVALFTDPVYAPATAPQLLPVVVTNLPENTSVVANPASQSSVRLISTQLPDGLRIPDTAYLPTSSGNEHHRRPSTGHL